MATQRPVIHPPGLLGLTQRERCCPLGLPNVQVVAELGVSDKTVAKALADS
jgi:hypothetical protein